MNILLATMRAMPLLAVSDQTHTDRIKFCMYLVSFVVIALSVLGIIWSVFGPVKRNNGSEPKQTDSNQPLCYVLAIAFALLVIALIKFSEANGSPYGGGP